ncbi:hypothetical protein EJB05_24290, partial [Eragrostis curvula]
MREVIEALHPPSSLKSVHLMGYPGEHLPNWFRPGKLPTFFTSRYYGYDGSVEHRIQNGVPIPTVIFDNNNGKIGSTFSSLTEIRIEGCEKLLTLEEFLQTSFLPALKKIVVENCQRLSLGSAVVSCLEELMVCDCPNIISGSLYAPCLKKLTLKDSGKLPSKLHLEMWSLPALQKFMITKCDSLTFIGESTIFRHRGSSSSGTFPSLTELEISNCRTLISCRMNISLQLRELLLAVAKSYDGCTVKCFLKNLTLLQSLEVVNCGRIVSAPGNLWCNSLVSLRELRIWNCPDLVSIGGPNAIAKIDKVHIMGCEKLMGIQQPLRRGGL